MRRAADLIVSPRLRIPWSELEFTFARSSGPGGQNVQKVNSKAMLRWHVSTTPSLPTDVRARFVDKFGSRLTTDGALVLSSQSTRDQGRNVDDCLNRLKAMILSIAKAPRRRRATKPTRSSVERRLTSKQRTGDKKRTRRTPPSD